MNIKYATEEERKKAHSARSKKYRDNNKEKIKEAKKIYREANLVKIKEKTKEWVKNNYLKYNNKQKEYYKNNKSNILKLANKYQKERRKNDITYKISCNMRSMIGNSITRKGYSKNSKTFDILGCSFNEFKSHLESKFESWMTWDNYGLYNGTECYGWDIDHKVPLSSAKTEDDIVKLNHHTNLHPLCSHINRDIKRGNY